ncbi:hypothetical protein [Microcoleus vaginatus]|uniref:hypothetical protein n=1 Tax=Microcoleus vaginatus TaxID=119532 RepID=UPI00168818D6|nr:hypothetical protein [Microcoleus sp. FACHB-84]MBD2008670.1 hypothetical protein [Microcoleus sp. FACHB-45]
MVGFVQGDRSIWQSLRWKGRSYPWIERSPVIPLWLDKIHFKNSQDISRLEQSQKTSNKFAKGVA